MGTNGDDAFFVWTRADGMHRLSDDRFNATASKVTSDGWVMGSAEVAPYEETPVVWDPQGRIDDVYGMVDPQSIYPVQAMGPTSAPAVDRRLRRRWLRAPAAAAPRAAVTQDALARDTR